MAHRSNSLTHSQQAPDRTLYALDWENLLGGVNAAAHESAELFHLWSVHGSAVAPGDRVVVSMSHRAARRAWFALPQRGIQRVIGSGQDGADLALINAIDITHASRRFSRLVIGSGDAIFTELAAKAALTGMVVEQIVGRGRPARSLAAACARTTQLPLDEACSHGLVLAA